MTINILDVQILCWIFRRIQHFWTLFVDMHLIFQSTTLELLVYKMRDFSWIMEWSSIMLVLISPTFCLGNSRNHSFSKDLQIFRSCCSSFHKNYCDSFLWNIPSYLGYEVFPLTGVTICRSISSTVPGNFTFLTKK